MVAGSFERECRVLRSIRHRNLIRVVTACSTPEFKAVVLPFMPNGSQTAGLAFTFSNAGTSTVCIDNVTLVPN